MLVLRRKPGERIRIGKDIYMEVLEVHGKQVHLGFTAPDAVKIMRTELDEAPKGEERVT